jgi:molecular chaperone HscB
MQNHFELFGLPAGYSIEISQLEQAYRDVQSKVHPDRFASGSDAERRVAMQWATRANEAYQTLKSPLMRARYLCELAGTELGLERNTAMAPAFLMQQMEWREALVGASASGSENALEDVEAQLNSARKSTEQATATALSEHNYALAVHLVRQWTFIEKFSDDVNAVRERLES